MLMTAPLTLAFPFIFSASMLAVSALASLGLPNWLRQDHPRPQIVERFSQYAEAVSVLVGVPALGWGVTQLSTTDATALLLGAVISFVLAFAGYSIILALPTKSWRAARTGLGPTGLSWVTLLLIAGNVFAAILLLSGVLSPPPTPTAG